MRQMHAFLKKEFLEQVRSGKLLVLAALFCLFGIMNPAIASLTPWLAEMLSEQLAENGMTVVGVEVSAMTSWVQYFKNMPMALVIFTVMFSSILTSEYQNKTLIHLVTRGMKRWKILLSKTMIMALFWTFGCFICYGITYGYNAYLWDNSIAEHIFFAAFCLYLAGVWIITVIPLASAFFGTTSVVVLSAGAVYLLSYLIGLIPEIKPYTPTYLMGASVLLSGTGNVGSYGRAIVIAVVLIVLNVAAAMVVFDKKSL